MEDIVLSPSDFVGVLNQTLEFAYPSVIIYGEIANFRVSKNRWVYFDLKDELSSVKFFGTVYHLPGPLEDGLTVQVRGTPRLHQLYGFSVNIMTIQPVGAGSIKKAASLLEAKLTKEGLFDPGRKRPLPYPPQSIGLITSGESAAYHDFVKILGQRFGGIDIKLADVQVQGEASPQQIVRAIEYFNQYAEPPEVLVITRGGGSADDLAAFSNEMVVRAVAGSRIPTIVAIGHEVDISLAELAADQRASTPSNAAELLTPDKKAVIAILDSNLKSMAEYVKALIVSQTEYLRNQTISLYGSLDNILARALSKLDSQNELLLALNPHAVLGRGYAIVRSAGKVVRSGKSLMLGTPRTLTVSFVLT